ncbi:MAG: class I SAM-dependent methyltransferase [Bdellovibrionales bacterium]
MLRQWLSEPDVRNISLDSDQRFNAHAAVLRRKRVLREVFKDFHRIFIDLDRRFFGAAPGLRIELGAGIAPVRDTDRAVLATDVVHSAGMDRALDAMSMDLPDRSVRAFYAQNCFHHFPSPARFFGEAQRVLVPGGGIIMIEPYFGPLASLIYPHLHRSEIFDPSMAGWEAPMTGPMGGANQALSHIVFWRDREKFQREFPDLSVVYTDPLNNYVRYILSGGLNFRQLVPDWASLPLAVLERALSPLRRWLAINHVIVIRRKDPFQN